MKKSLYGIPFALVSLTIAGCAATTDGDPAGQDEATRSTAAALSSNLALPQGLTCGLYYTNNAQSWGGIPGPNGSGVNPEYCDGAESASPGYNFVFAGDLGAHSGQGFYNNSLFLSTSSGQELSSDRLPLPRGVDCGFKNSKNDPSQTCLGYDSAVSCPYGWQQRKTNDASSSATFSWCEYEDIHALCPGDSCRANVPLGTACGISHNGSNGVLGICESVESGPGFPDLECPYGWFVTDPPLDMGAPSGVGIQYCFRAF